MGSEEYRKKIEKEVLAIIEEKLKNQQMNSARAKEIANYILESFNHILQLTRYIQSYKILINISQNLYQ